MIVSVDKNSPQCKNTSHTEFSMTYCTDFSTFTKKKDYLICVDSDGCAMDTMDIKHFNCFGPCMVDEWQLHQWKESILHRWNEINLYTITRGINRFKGLAMALTEIHKQYCPIDGIAELVDWAQTSPELSNDALRRHIDSHPNSAIFAKALSWSKAVNKAITNLPEEEIKPFSCALEALQFAHERADVAIVSSANIGAVLEEWQRHGLIQHTDIVLAQNAGSKAFCIGELLKKGYDKNKVLMCGDALGDLQAAEKNGVLYYPILVRNEKASWQQFISQAFDKLLDGTYQGEYQAKKRAEFLKNLGE